MDTIKDPGAAGQSARSAAEELARSRDRLTETRARIAAGHAEFVSEVVALAFQLGRMQGHAEAAQDRIAEMAAEAGPSGPAVNNEPSVADYLSDTLDVLNEIRDTLNGLRDDTGRDGAR